MPSPTPRGGAKYRSNYRDCQKNPAMAARAIEALFNIAGASISALEEARKANPNAHRKFAGFHRKWPHMLTKGKRWTKTQVPDDVREVLFEMGLGESVPISSKAKSDVLGRVIKWWFMELYRRIEYPDMFESDYENYLANLEDEEIPGDEYSVFPYLKKVRLPKFKRDKTTLRKWAKAIFDLIFLDDLWLIFGKDAPWGALRATEDDIRAAGIELVKLSKGESKLCDKKMIAYSLLRTCSDTYMKRMQSGNKKLRQECSKEGKNLLKAKGLLKRRYGLEWADPAHPKDDQLKEEAIDKIAGRLKSYPA